MSTPTPPGSEEASTWHRRFGAGANDRAWTLTEQSSLSPSEESELLDAAHAAAFHWRQIGSESEVAHAELLLGRAHALLGNGMLAMRFARSAFDAIVAQSAQDWELAFAHAVLADAGAAAEDSSLHSEHYAEAKRIGDSLAGPNRDLFLATFIRIPIPS